MRLPKLGITVVILALFLLFSQISRAIETNWMGVQALVVCQPNASIETERLLTEISESPFGMGAYRCLGDAIQERTSAKKFVIAFPNRIDLLRTQYPTDIRLAQIAVDTHPDVADAWFWLGEASVETNSFDAAVQAYEHGLSLSPTVADAWMDLGRLYQDHESWETAAKAFDQACFYVDHGKNGCPSAGKLYLENEDFENAARSYRNAVRQLPYWEPARMGLRQSVMGLVDYGKIEQAVDYLETLIDLGDTEAKEIFNQIQEDLPAH